VERALVTRQMGARRSETRSGTRCGEVLRYEGGLLLARGGSGGESMRCRASAGERRRSCGALVQLHLSAGGWPMTARGATARREGGGGFGS
jgi:hypothetical protein